MENEGLLSDLAILKASLLAKEEASSKYSLEKAKYENINNKIEVVRANLSEQERINLIALADIKKAKEEPMNKLRLTRKKILSYFTMALITSVLLFFILLIIFSIIPNVEDWLSEKLSMNVILTDVLLSLVLGFIAPIFIIIYDNRKEHKRIFAVEDSCINDNIEESNDKSLKALEAINRLNKELKELEEELSPINNRLKELKEIINRNTIEINNIARQSAHLVSLNNIDQIINLVEANKASSLAMAIEMLK